MPPMDEVKPWAQTPKETSKAYAAFIAYRDMGVQRSLHAVGTLLGKSKELMERWSMQHKWVERVKAWDAYQITMATETAQAQRNTLRAALIERELQDYQKAMLKFDEVWDRTKLHERHIRQTDEHGKTTEIIELNVSDWRELTRWREDISRLGRRALGMPDKITRTQTEDVDVTKLSDSELDKLINSES